MGSEGSGFIRQMLALQAAPKYIEEPPVSPFL